jgi:hypothetical protein
MQKIAAANGGSTPFLEKTTPTDFSGTYKLAK